MDFGVNINKEVSSRLEDYLDSLKSQWDISHPKSSLSKRYIFECTAFIISFLDELIVFVQKHVKGGSEKKTIVLSMSSDVFNYIVERAFPIWLRPFAPMIKEIVVSIIISNLIEFIVKKYKEGLWNNEKDVNMTQNSIVYISKGGLDG